MRGVVGLVLFVAACSDPYSEPPFTPVDARPPAVGAHFVVFGDTLATAFDVSGAGIP